jgi:hypothetical protein
MNRTPFETVEESVEAATRGAIAPANPPMSENEARKLWLANLDRPMGAPRSDRPAVKRGKARRGFSHEDALAKDEAEAAIARIAEDEYIASLEQELERTMRMKEDRKIFTFEKSFGLWAPSAPKVAVPETAFIAMRNEEDSKKVTALFSLEQQRSSNFRNWHIRYLTGDPTVIAPRRAESADESEDPWKERYKLYAWLGNHRMRLFVERRYQERDFSYFSSKREREHSGSIDRIRQDSGLDGFDI